MPIDGISIVTTTYNEKENIEELVQRIRKALSGIPHEIIIVDDSSPDDTYETARRHADTAIRKPREGQTAGLLTGIKTARHPHVVTIDADLENPPELIPQLLHTLETRGLDILVASRETLPRLSEKLASKTLGRIFGVSDVYSNYRILRRETLRTAETTLGETFGAELLLTARKNGYTIGEHRYRPPPRRHHPRIGGTLRAELRILWATVKIAANV